MPKRPKSVEAYLPLKPIQFWVLLVLVDVDHGKPLRELDDRIEVALGLLAVLSVHRRR